MSAHILTVATQPCHHTPDRWIPEGLGTLWRCLDCDHVFQVPEGGATT